MSQAVLVGIPTMTPELQAKLRLVEIAHVPKSDLPFRVTKKRTGVVLGSYKSQDEVEAFLTSYPISHLQSKPKRKPAR